MYTVKSICLFALGMFFLAYPCLLHGQDEIDAEIRDEMMALHPESSDYTRNYFKNVLQQMGHALPKAEEGNSPKTVPRETGKETGDEVAGPPSGRSVGKVNNPTSSETVAADKPMTHAWHIIMVCGVFLLALAILAFVALFSTRRTPLSRKDHG